MIRFFPAVFLTLLSLTASAATMGPTSQTLEAIRGAAVTDPGNFFDGLAAHVSLVAPEGYAPLPETRTPSAATLFDSRRIAPGVTVHEPLPAARPAPAEKNSSVKQVLLVVGAALIAAAVLLLIFL